MRMGNLSYVMFILGIGLLFLISGCIGQPSKASPSPAGVSPTVDPVMGQIDASLEKGPVFIEFGAPWCSWCEKQKPILNNLTNEYPGVYFYSVNTDENQELPDAFYVNGIPQMNMIAKKNADGTYLYIDPYGKPTADRRKSAIIGYTPIDQLRPVFDAAWEARR